jgi:3-dehydroquinate synthase
MTDFRMRHGEAVAIGIALDVTYAAMAGHCDESAVEAVRGCLSDLGFALYDDALTGADELLEGLEEFREHLGGRLTIPLLREIGVGFEVHDIDRARMRSAIERLYDERGTAIRRVS